MDVPRPKIDANKIGLTIENLCELREKAELAQVTGSYWKVIQELLVSQIFFSKAFKAARVSASFLLCPSP